MTDGTDLGLFIVLIVVIEGIWLAGLTYLLWRSHLLKKKSKSPPEQGDAGGVA